MTPRSPSRRVASVALVVAACALAAAASCSLLLAPTDGLDPVDGDGDADADGDARDADRDEDADRPDADAPRPDGDVVDDADAEPDADAPTDADGASDADQHAGDADDDADRADECPFGCDDGIPCTADSCADGRCANEPDNGLCTGEGEVCTPRDGCGHVVFVDCGCAPPDACGEGTVDAPWPGIADAVSSIAARGARTVVHVAAGTCSEVGFDYAAATPLTIEGDGSGAPGAPATRWVHATSDRALKITGTANVTIRNLYISHEKRGVELEDTASCLLERVVLDNHTEHGLKQKARTGAVLRQSVVTRNRMAGLYAVDDASLEVENCLIARNGGEQAGGILVEDAVTLRVVNSTIADNTAAAQPAGIWVRSVVAAELRSLVIWNNVGAVGTQCEGCVLSSDSFVDDPDFVTAGLRTEVDDYRLAPASPAHDRAVREPWHPPVDFWGRWRSDALIDAGFHELAP